MATLSPLLLLLLLAPLVITASSSAETLLQMMPGNLLTSDLYCNAWRLSVESNNAGAWSSIPSACTDFIHEYVNSEQFAWDFMVVANESLAYAKSLNLSGNGTDTWVFDFDDTLVSNVGYYSICGWDWANYNETCYDEWVNSGSAPATAGTLELYDELKALGFRLVILSGRKESLRNATVNNLLLAGYSDWDQLIMKEASYNGLNAIVYKSIMRENLVAEGYKIQGNSGDQWSDLLGSSMAKRSFKNPNPMYYTK